MDAKKKNGQMDPISCNVSGYPVEFQTICLVDKEIKTKFLRTDCHVNATLSHLEFYHFKKLIQGEKKHFSLCFNIALKAF